MRYIETHAEILANYKSMIIREKFLEHKLLEIKTMVEATTSTLDKTVSFQTYRPGGKILNYVIKKEELEKELKNTLEEKNYYKDLLTEIYEVVKELKGIESDLYKSVVFDGLNVNKAVETVADKYNMSDRQIWKYYDKIKKYLIK